MLASAIVLTSVTTAGLAASEADIPRCGSRGDLADLLRTAFGEIKVARGLSVDGSLIEVFAGPGETFTVMKTQPTGHACIVDAGFAWHADAPRPEHYGN